jgi:hypothetical protein
MFYNGNAVKGTVLADKRVCFNNLHGQTNLAEDLESR